jgi:hypothetical protein
MIAGGFSAVILHDCLAEMEPARLLGMDLLRQVCPNATIPFPVSQTKLQETVTQMVTYTSTCAATLERLRHLSPIPLITVPQSEFGL